MEYLADDKYHWNASTLQMNDGRSSLICIKFQIYKCLYFTCFVLEHFRTWTSLWRICGGQNLAVHNWNVCESDRFFFARHRFWVWCERHKGIDSFCPWSETAKRKRIVLFFFFFSFWLLLYFSFALFMTQVDRSQVVDAWTSFSGHIRPAHATAYLLSHIE